jgi:hypothetical protein
MSDPTAVWRAVAIELTEGEAALAAAAGALEAAAVRRGGAAAAPPAPAARRRALPEPARLARTRLRAVATAVRASPQNGAASPAALDTTAQALRMLAQAARSGADAAQARANGAPPTDPTVQHAAVACRSACTLAWQQAVRVRAAALHATVRAVLDACTALTDLASDAAAWPR